MKSKIEKLVGLVGQHVRVIDLKRLDDGELAPIGDAIIAGKEITRGGKVTPVEDCIFNSPASHYTIKQEMRSLNGYEYPAPETEAPKVGVRYYVPDTACDNLFSWYVWENDDFDRKWLTHREVHLSEENAIAHTKAIILAGGGEI